MWVCSFSDVVVTKHVTKLKNFSSFSDAFSVVCLHVSLYHVLQSTRRSNWIEGFFLKRCLQKGETSFQWTEHDLLLKNFSKRTREKNEREERERVSRSSHPPVVSWLLWSSLCGFDNFFSLEQQHQDFSWHQHCQSNKMWFKGESVFSAEQSAVKRLSCKITSQLVCSSYSCGSFRVSYSHLGILSHISSAFNCNVQQKERVVKSSQTL